MAASSIARTSFAGRSRVTRTVSSLAFTRFGPRGIYYIYTAYTIRVNCYVYWTRLCRALGDAEFVLVLGLLDHCSALDRRLDGLSSARIAN